MLAEIANSAVSLTLQSRTEANSTANVSTIPNSARGTDSVDVSECFLVQVVGL